MVRQKTRDAFTATTSHKQKMAAKDKSTYTSLEVSAAIVQKTQRLMLFSLFGSVSPHRMG